MAEDVLGITGIVNIDDIQKTFDALIGDLDRLGVETEQISSRMTKALTDIANSSEKDLAAKTKAAMQVLNEAIAETNKQLQHTPETLKNAEQEASRLQSAVAKLEKELSGTVVGSKEFNALQKQLQSERETLRLQTADVQDMKAANEHAAQSVQHLQDIYETFVSQLQQQGTATQETTQATDAQAEATERATRATQEQTKAEKEHAGTQKDVQAAIEDTQNTIDELVAKQEKAQKRMAKLKEDMQQWAASGIEKGYIKQTGEGRYKADPKAAGYNENVIAQMQRIAKEYNELKDSLREYRDEEILAREGLSELKQSLQEVEQQTQQTTRATEDAMTKSPRQMLMELRNEITMLTLQYRDMTDAEKASAEGQALQKKLDELQAKAAKLQDAFSDVQETIKHDASDTAAFAGLTQGLNLVISGFGAAEGAAAAFGMSEEDLARAQTIIQGSLAATNFLTETSNALQGQSALMRGINTLQTWASAKAIDMETAAKGRNIIATKAASAAQAIFNAIAKANPYVLLAMALVTVVGALAAFTIGSKKATEAEQKQREEAEKLKEELNDYANSVGSEFAKLQSSYKTLQSQWRQLRTEHEKNKWIKDNKKEIDNLTTSVNSAKSAEKFFGQQTENVVRSFQLRAQAAAQAALAVKKYQEAMTLQEQATSAEGFEGTTLDAKYYNQIPAQFRSMLKQSKTHRINTEISATNLYKSSQGAPVGDVVVDEYKLENVTAEFAAWLKAHSFQNTSKMRQSQQLMKAGDELIEGQARLLEQAQKLNSWNDSNTTDTDTRPTKDKPQYKSAAELNDELLQLTKERIEAELEAEEQGTKRWEQLQRERIAIQAEIDRRAAQKAGDEAVADLDASYNGGKSGLTKQQYNERRAQLQQQTSQLLAAINAKEQNDLAEVTKIRITTEQKAEDELIAKYQSYIDKKKKIDADYAQALQELDKAIVEAQARGDSERVEALQRSKAQAAQQHNEQQAQLSLQQLKETPDYVRAFEDLGNTSTQTLQYLIQQFEEAKEAAAQSLDPEKLREYTSTLQQMYDAIQERDPWAAMKQSATELANAENRLKVATLAVATAKQRVKEAERTGDVQALARAKKELADAEEKERKATDNVEKSKNKYNKAQKAALQQVNELANAIAGLGDAIGGTEGQILGIASGVMTFMTQTIEGIKAVTATGVAALSTLEKASVILAIISAAIQLFQKISSLYKDAHAQYEEYAAKIKEINDLRDAVNEYRLAVLQATQAERKWFASTGLQNLRDMYEYSNMALEQYVAKMLEAQAIYQNESGGGWLTNALKWIGNLVVDIITAPGKLITGALDKMGILGDNTFLSKIIDFGLTGVIGKGLEEMMNSLDAYEEGTTAAFKNLRIETRSSSSGFLGTGIGGHSQRTEDLVTWAKDKFGEDLFDSNGFINTELANTILDKYGDKLVGETKETLEELVKLKEEYDKFREQLQEYVSDMFSPLTEDMTDALWDWLKEGKDVMDSFKKYASDTFADIAKEMIKQALLQKVFDGFQDKLTNLYEAYSMGALDEKTLADGVMQATDALLNNAEKQLPMIQDLLTYIDEKFKERGFDITGSEAFEQSASSKAWQTMSQDSADELNGRFTALYECGLQILDYNVQNNELLVLVQADISQTRLAVVTLSQNMTELLDVQYDNLNKLDEIIANTAPLPDMAAVVEKIYNAVKNVNKK